MIDAAQAIWAKIQQLFTDVKELKAHDKEVDREVDHLERKIELLSDQVKHHNTVQNHQGMEMTKLDARVKELEKERHSLAIKLGIQKSKNEKLIAPRLPLDEPQKPRPRKH
jgi:chromosome segregation ATPase